MYFLTHLRALIKTCERVNIPRVPRLSSLLENYPVFPQISIVVSRTTDRHVSRVEIGKGTTTRFRQRVQCMYTENSFLGRVQHIYRVAAAGQSGKIFFWQNFESLERGVRKGLRSSCLNELRHTRAQVRGCTLPLIDFFLRESFEFFPISRLLFTANNLFRYTSARQTIIVQVREERSFGRTKRITKTFD